MTRKILAVLFALALVLLYTCDYGNPFEKLRADIQDELDERYADAQNSDEAFPGATVAVGFSDGRVAGFSVGFSDVENRMAMSPDSRMPSGSIGKTFVAALVLSMVADGSLDLDGKISAWLGDEPWFERLPNRDTITLRHLLNHSSGIIDHVFDEDSGFSDYFREQLTGNSTKPAIDPRKLVQFALDREPLFAAGEGFHYSDTGYILVGLIIEKMSGSTYYQELNSRFLRPLNLSHTTPLTQKEVAGSGTRLCPGKSAASRPAVESPGRRNPGFRSVAGMDRRRPCHDFA